MKKFFFGIMAGMVVCVHSGYAATGFGVCQYGKETVSSVECFGPTNLTETTIKGSVSVKGPLEASKTTMQSMSVQGMANLTHSNIKANVQIAGFLTANHGNFAGDMSIAADKAVLNASTVKGSITIRSEQGNPELELRCGTQVLGSITFLKNPGIVKKSKDSKITGKVSNGTVEEIENGRCEAM